MRDSDPNYPVSIADTHVEPCPLGFHALQISYPDEVIAAAAWNTRLASPQPTADRSEAEARTFTLGDRVFKSKGSSWTGRVVGFYSTSLTPEGYAVESENEAGSVQIYPRAALVTCPEVPAPAQPVGGEVMFEVWQDDMQVAASTYEADARHYLAVYAQDGPATLMRATTYRAALQATGSVVGEG